MTTAEILNPKYEGRVKQLENKRLLQNKSAEVKGIIVSHFKATM